MIKWKSLFFFLLTLLVILGFIVWGGVYGYGKGLEKLAEKHPEIKFTPQDTVTYELDNSKIKDYVQLKESGYVMMVPKDCSLRKVKGDPAFQVVNKKLDWEIRIYPKMLRYEETIISDKFIKNPDGDYYVLLNEILKSTKNPILLVQKMSYLPSTTTKIANVKTPNFFGFSVFAGEGKYNSVIYYLFDNNYWHKIETFYPSDSEKAGEDLRLVLSSLSNDVEEEVPFERKIMEYRKNEAKKRI